MKNLSILTLSNKHKSTFHIAGKVTSSSSRKVTYLGIAKNADHYRVGSQFNILEEVEITPSTIH